MECCGVSGEGVRKEIEIQSVHQGIPYFLRISPYSGGHNFGEFNDRAELRAHTPVLEHAHRRKQAPGRGGGRVVCVCTHTKK